MRTVGPRRMFAFRIITGIVRLECGIGTNDLRTREIQIAVGINSDSAKYRIGLLDLLLREPLPFGFGYPVFSFSSSSLVHFPAVAAKTFGNHPRDSNF